MTKDKLIASLSNLATRIGIDIGNLKKDITELNNKIIKLEDELFYKRNPNKVKVTIDKKE